MSKSLKQLIDTDWKVYGPDVGIKNITDDSRKVTIGSLFVAVSGLTLDAHQFIPNAVAQGAVVIVGEQEPEGEWLEKVSYIKVPNSRQAFGQIAAAWFDHPSDKLKVIGVTGTDGKTTTTYFIHQILIRSGLKAGMISTVKALVGNKEFDTGFHTTTPGAFELQSILNAMVQQDIEYAVLEVTSIGIHQHRIAGTKFDIAVLTNITPEHMAYHKSFEEYRDVKLELFKQTPVAVLNKEDNSFGYFKDQLKDKKIIEYPEDSKEYPISFSESFNILNAQATIAVSRELNVVKEKVREAVKRLTLPEGRLEKISNTRGIDIYIDFAHTPNSLKNVLQSLKRKTNGKLIVVFGCASERDDYKRPVMGEIASKLADTVVLTAEDPRKEDVNKIINEIVAGIPKGYDNYHIKQERGEAITFAVNTMAREGDTVVICGKGHEKSMNYDGIEYPWSDREAVEKALQGESLEINRNG